MIELQEYLDAGFSDQQARLLIARDLRWQQSVESVRADMTRGFAELTAIVLAGFNQIGRQFAHVEKRLDGIDQQLGRIEESLRHVTPN